jgi:hypothetical protein
MITPTEERVTAFETLKALLVSAPVLRTPDLTKPFILDCDSSIRQIGACLAQQFDDGEHPVAYFSAKLSDAQTRYSITELEALAVLRSLGKFDNLIYGRPIVVRTDHSALTGVINGSPPSARLERWKIALNRYNLTIVHRSGSDSENCDALSRLDRSW